MSESFTSVRSPHISHPAGGSSLPESLILAYLTTEYRIHEAGHTKGFTLQVGREQPTLLGLMKRHSSSSAAFITAWNPFGEQLTAAENKQLNRRLQEELSRRSLRFMAGIGQGDSGDWPGEESYLVFGLDMIAAKRLGEAFQQNALVWVGPDAVPQLVLLQ